MFRCWWNQIVTVGPQAPDQAHQRAGLRLRGRPRARVVGAAERPPAVREVAVQVDSARVAARSGSVPVRVCVRDEPQVDAVERPETPQPVDDGDPGALVPVDAADDQHLARGGGIAELVGDDPAGPQPSDRRRLRRCAEPPAASSSRASSRISAYPHASLDASWVSSGSSSAAVLLVAAAGRSSRRRARRATRSARTGSRARDAAPSLWGAVIAAEAAARGRRRGRRPGRVAAAAATARAVRARAGRRDPRGAARARPAAASAPRSRIGWPRRGADGAAGGGRSPPCRSSRTRSRRPRRGSGSASPSRSSGCVALAVRLLALARELGELRLAVAPQAALSIDHEGPELGGRVAPDRPLRGPSAARRRGLHLAGLLAVRARSSRRCGCSPTIPRSSSSSSTRRPTPTPGPPLGVPGSPYAVVLAPDGEVLAKGTFNSLYQLESLLGARDEARRCLSESVAGSAARGAGFLARTGRLLVGARRRRPRAGARCAPRRPRPSTSAATSTRPARARIPSGLPRIDAQGLSAARGRRQAGRRPRPRRRQARPARRRQGRRCCATPTAARCRRRRARRVCTRRPRVRLPPQIDGAWYRCCGGHVRKLVDCCGYVAQPDQRRRRADRLLLPRPARSSASCTTTRRSSADRGARARPGLLVGLAGAWSP